MHTRFAPSVSFRFMLRAALIVALLLTAVLAALLPATTPAAAQRGGERIELAAADELTLVGTYYAPTDTADADGAPAVLLMHHSASQKEAWIDFIPVLVEHGYAALTVDLRGHGETGGDTDWPQAEDDTHRWLAWLRDQPGIDPARVSIVGASIGADVGLRVMAQDAELATLVALSVGLDVAGVMTEEAVASMDARPLFLVAAQGVEEERIAVQTLLAAATGDVQARLYEGTACCTFFFMLEPDLADSIILWLDRYAR